jgi:HD superfamily phosphohydrolase
MEDEDLINGTPTTYKPKSNTAKMVNDPVHGHFTLPNYVVQVVDTPQFQRLRDLKQLGISYYLLL